MGKYWKFSPKYPPPPDFLNSSGGGVTPIPCQFQMNESLSDTYGYSEFFGRPCYNVSCDMFGSSKSRVYTQVRVVNIPQFNIAAFASF